MPDRLGNDNGVAISCTGVDRERHQRQQGDGFQQVTVSILQEGQTGITVAPGCEQSDGVRGEFLNEDSFDSTIKACPAVGSCQWVFSDGGLFSNVAAPPLCRGFFVQTGRSFREC